MSLEAEQQKRPTLRTRRLCLLIISCAKTTFFVCVLFVRASQLSSRVIVFSALTQTYKFSPEQKVIVSELWSVSVVVVVARNVLATFCTICAPNQWSAPSVILQVAV